MASYPGHQVILVLVAIALVSFLSGLLVDPQVFDQPSDRVLSLLGWAFLAAGLAWLGGTSTGLIPGPPWFAVGPIISGVFALALTMLRRLSAPGA
jgi:hypothetical protein